MKKLFFVFFLFVFCFSTAMAGNVKYRVRVRTGVIEHSGTSANVQIKLIGDKGDTLRHLLDTRDHDDFEKGGNDLYTFTDKNIGAVNAIEIGHDNSRKGPGWYLVRVRVRGPNNKLYIFTYDDWLDEDRGKLSTIILEDSLKQDPRLDIGPARDEHIGYTYEFIDNRHGTQPYSKSVNVLKDVSKESFIFTDKRTSRTVKTSGSAGINLGVFKAGGSASVKWEKFFRGVESTRVKERLRIKEKYTWRVPAGEVLAIQYDWKVKKKSGEIRWGSKRYGLGLIEDMRYDIVMVSLQEVNGRIAIPATLKRRFQGEVRRKFANSYIDRSNQSQRIVLNYQQMQRYSRGAIVDVGALTGGSQRRQQASGQIARIPTQLGNKPEARDRRSRKKGERTAISLKSAHNGKYVRAGIGSDTLLGAVSDHYRGWEKFELVTVAGKIVAFKSSQNGKYVRVGSGADGLMSAKSSRIGKREKFEMISAGGGKFAFKSVYNGKYVRAGIGRNTLLGASSPHIRAWEKFYLKYRAR